MITEITTAFAAVPDLAIGAVAGFLVGVVLTSSAPKLLAAGKSAAAKVQAGATWVRGIPARAAAEKVRLVAEAKAIAAKAETATLAKAEAAEARLALHVAAAVAAELAKLQVSVAVAAPAATPASQAAAAVAPAGVDTPAA